MGQLKHDGRATQGGVTVPDGQAVEFGELYRIGKINGFAMSTIAADDDLRDLDLEIACDRVWYIEVPSALSGANVGDILHWEDTADFKVGSTDLVAAGTAGAGAAAAWVEEAPDANNIAAVRVLNIG